MMNTIMATEFEGFSEAAVKFYEEIAQNNEKAWFEANKPVFKKHVQEPAQAFVVALGERLKKMSSGIRYDTRLSGAGSIMRIYRDVRFSADKTPYKTTLDMVWWEGNGKKMAHPAVYIRFSAQGGGLHVGMHGFPKDLLTAYREAVAGERGEELAETVTQIQAAGYGLGGQHYKRVPRGYDADHPRAELLKHNGLYASAPSLSVAELTSADLVDICYGHAEKMAPLHQWLVALQNEAHS